MATAWEKILDEIPAPGTRKVKLRSAVIMNPDRGSISATLLALVRRGLGGTSGDGRQYVSWIHEMDFVRAVYFLIERDDIDGPINLASPNRCPIVNSWPTCAGRGEQTSVYLRQSGCLRSELFPADGNGACVEKQASDSWPSTSGGILFHVSGLGRSRTGFVRPVEKTILVVVRTFLSACWTRDKLLGTGC